MAVNRASGTEINFTSDGTNTRVKLSVTTDDVLAISGTASNLVKVTGTYEDGSEGAVTITNAESPYSITSNDKYLGVNTSSGAVTITLLAIANAPVRPITITDESGNAATNTITIDGNGGETINGETTFVLNQNYNSLTIRPNVTKSEWIII